MSSSDNIKPVTKVPIRVADELIKSIRLLAITGKKLFKKFLYEPLNYAGWVREHSNENARKMMERINRACLDENALHTVGPLCKRLISLSLTENLSSVGDSCIFFLEKMTLITNVSMSSEATEFTSIIQGPMQEFTNIHKNKSEKIFEESLKSLSSQDIKDAFEPVHLGKQQIQVKFQNEASILFEKIRTANSRDDLPRCLKLISTYLIKYAEQEDNNRDEVDKLIDAFQKRDGNFRMDIQEAMAINLYFQIIGGITEGDLKKAIRGIRKYAFIFQGDPGILYFNEIDNLERKLYTIIKEKDLMQELKKA